MISWKIEKRKISQLKPHPKNPRLLSAHDAEHLQKSLEKFGLIDKPVINTDNTVIGGHQRLKILKKMGLKEIEVYVPEEKLESNDVDELNIRLNRNAGEFDYDILANEWEQASLMDWGFTHDDLVGDDSKEIESDMEEENELLEPGKDEEAITKIGDRFDLLGSDGVQHTIVCGDSTLPDDVSRCLSGQIPILMVTDPPYGVEYDPSWRAKAGKGQRASGKVKNDDKVNWSLVWSLFPGSVAYIWHAGRFSSEVQKSLENADFEIVSQIIWAKQHFALSRGDYHWQHEPCWYAVKKECSHNWKGARDQSTLWEIANLNAFGKASEDERTAHSTQKPLECMLRPIRNNTEPLDRVYDPFLGSGTTLIAAETSQRICHSIEISPAYCDIAIKRWIKFRKQKNQDFKIKRNGKATRDFDGE